MKRAKRARRATKKPSPVGEGVLAPSRAWRIGRWVVWAALALVLALATALLVVFPSSHGPGGGRDVELVVVGDESADALAARLAAAGLTERPRLFALYIRFTGGARRAARGTHLVTDDLSPRELMARLERGTGAGRVKVTIPEGWTRFDIARRLQSLHVCTLRAWLDATSDPALLRELHIPPEASPSLAEPASAEGFLFPATYDFAPDSDPADVVRRMKAEFDKRYGALEERNGPGVLDLVTSLGWGAREIVTLASMIEKEAAVDEERSIIASVFLNRLRDPAFTPRLLQCDPTAGYGCLVAPEQAPSCASYTGKITHDIVADAGNPYNTYKHEGLPPGPISNPGAKSLDAVMSPATTRYFYFVARGEGRHTFSETYAGHAAAVHGSSPPLK